MESYLQWCADDDDGVPPFCQHIYCPLHHENKWFNDNEYVRRIGHVGYRYFDVNRRLYLGLASLVTVAAMILTTFGCFALSTARLTVQRTYWAAATGLNETSGEYFSMYVGLRSAVFVNCQYVPGFDKYGPECIRQSIEWTSNQCVANTLIQEDVCTSCASTATSLWIVSFMACFTLILSLLGAQTRLRRNADCPIQKILGMFAEAWGALSLAFALYTFQQGCYVKLANSFNMLPNVISTTWIGPGWLCYVFCCITGVIRATVHWLTPLPGHGEGVSTVFRLCPCGSCRDYQLTNTSSSSSSSSSPDVHVTINSKINNKQDQQRSGLLSGSSYSNGSGRIAGRGHRSNKHNQIEDNNIWSDEL